jgi:two-component system response regulator PfeR
MTSPASILVIEDDHVLNQQICQLLDRQGFVTHSQYDGETGLTEATRGSYDLILLDALLPNRDGYSLLNILRKTSQIPVMMVTAKGAEEERIRGLQSGADDYLSKPFNKTELLLRVEALLRRTHHAAQATAQTVSQRLELDGLKLDKLLKEARVFNQKIELTQIQFSLLWILLSNQKEILSKPYLYQNALNKSYGVHDRSLDMHLSRIRRKLDEAAWQGERLQTVHGKGYCLR